MSCFQLGGFRHVPSKSPPSTSKLAGTLILTSNFERSSLFRHQLQFYFWISRFQSEAEQLHRPSFACVLGFVLSAPARPDKLVGCLLLDVDFSSTNNETNSETLVFRALRLVPLWNPVSHRRSGLLSRFARSTLISWTMFHRTSFLPFQKHFLLEYGQRTKRLHTNSPHRASLYEQTNNCISSRRIRGDWRLCKFLRRMRSWP